MALDLYGVPIIESFDHEFEFLSNFYRIPVTLEGITFPSSEHAYQWHKALDPEKKAWIIYKDPVNKIWTSMGESKRRGKAVERSDWDDALRFTTMQKVVRAKFTQNPDVRKKLIDTWPSYIEEGNNWHDNFFGSCRCDAVACGDTGLNFLGKLHMSLREEFLAEMEHNEQPISTS